MDDTVQKIYWCCYVLINFCFSTINATWSVASTIMMMRVLAMHMRPYQDPMKGTINFVINCGIKLVGLFTCGFVGNH